MAINVDKAFDVNAPGLVFRDDDGNVLFYLCTGAGDPTGSDAPVNSIYFDQNTQHLHYKFDTGVNDWSQINVDDILLGSIPTYRSSNVTLLDALVELRNNIVTAPDNTDTTLNGTLELDIDSKTLQIINGTATGFSVEMPDASANIIGAKYEIVNESTESITVKDADSTTLFTLNQESFAFMTLQSNGSSAGSWLFTILSSTATGITSFVTTSDTLFSTSSTTDDIITSFSVTPESGRYSLFYSAEVTISNNNRKAECVAYVDGSAIENTRRKLQGVGATFEASQQTIGEISVDGTEDVDIRVNIDEGSLDVTNRSLVLIRLGSV